MWVVNDFGLLGIKGISGILGKPIPPEAKTYYDLLGDPLAIRIDPDLDERHLRTIFLLIEKKIMDVSPNPHELGENLKSLNGLWQILGNPEARKKYNEDVAKVILGGGKLEQGSIIESKTTVVSEPEKTDPK